MIVGNGVTGVTGLAEGALVPVVGTTVSITGSILGKPLGALLITTGDSVGPGVPTVSVGETEGADVGTGDNKLMGEEEGLGDGRAVKLDSVCKYRSQNSPSTPSESAEISSFAPRNRTSASAICRMVTRARRALEQMNFIVFPKKVNIVKVCAAYKLVQS